jgi:hypothetical protein
MTSVAESVDTRHLELAYETRDKGDGWRIFTLYARFNGQEVGTWLKGSRKVSLEDALFPVAQHEGIGFYPTEESVNGDLHNTLRSLPHNFPELKEGFTYSARPLGTDTAIGEFRGQVTRERGDIIDIIRTTIHKPGE